MELVLIAIPRQTEKNMGEERLRRTLEEAVDIYFGCG